MTYKKINKKKCSPSESTVSKKLSRIFFIYIQNARESFMSLFPALLLHSSSPRVGPEEHTGPRGEVDRGDFVMYILYRE